MQIITSPNLGVGPESRHSSPEAANCRHVSVTARQRRCVMARLLSWAVLLHASSIRKFHRGAIESGASRQPGAPARRAASCQGA